VVPTWLVGINLWLVAAQDGRPGRFRPLGPGVLIQRMGGNLPFQQAGAPRGGYSNTGGILAALGWHLARPMDPPGLGPLLFKSEGRKRRLAARLADQRGPEEGPRGVLPALVYLPRRKLDSRIGLQITGQEA